MKLELSELLKRRIIHRYTQRVDNAQHSIAVISLLCIKLHYITHKSAFHQL
jgi:hypothetical protein